MGVIKVVYYKDKNESQIVYSRNLASIALINTYDKMGVKALEKIVGILKEDEKVSIYIDIIVSEDCIIKQLKTDTNGNIVLVTPIDRIFVCKGLIKEYDQILSAVKIIADKAKAIHINTIGKNIDVYDKEVIHKIEDYKVRAVHNIISDETRVEFLLINRLSTQYDGGTVIW